MESCEAAVSSSVMPCSQNLSLRFAGSVPTSEPSSSVAGSRARSRSHSSNEVTTLVTVQSVPPVSAGQDAGGDTEANSCILHSAAHYITTRSATGRLAKRPKRDPSPPMSPPRKTGENSSNIQRLALIYCCCQLYLAVSSRCRYECLQQFS